MMIERYPVGWALDAGKPEPVLAYLIDLPSVAMQGKTWPEAADKLRAFAPAALAAFRNEGSALPTPSKEPTLRIGVLRWFMASHPVESGPSSRPLEVGAEVELVTV